MFHFRGADFRTVFQDISKLRCFFSDAPFVALSGTLTNSQKEVIPKLLKIKNFYLVERSPDKPNVFLEKFINEAGVDVIEQYERIVHPICDELSNLRDLFPVTLLFIPVFYMSEAVMYLNSLFGSSNIENSLFSAICSGQDEYVINYTMSELKKMSPKIRLVLTTSISGMGFDPENVTRVIHANPPRNISQYFQEVGRAGTGDMFLV